MGLSITGYVLEPIRVGAANSPFTFTPDIVITDQAAFDAAFPSAETEPRADYHVFVLADGKLSAATFCWTKNEVINRFTYDGKFQRFKTLPGASVDALGTLEADANTTRLTAVPPTSSVVASYPYRLSVGTGSGTTFTVVLVADDVNFGAPAVGTAEIAQSTGNINWNPADITTFLGQDVRFQRQTFFAADESDGNLGVIEADLLLNPIPAVGQFPLIRIGFGEYLTPVYVATEAGFSADPVAGTVEWAGSTGRLKFNSGDITANTGRPVYYDGSTFGFGLSLTSVPIGTVAAPGFIGLPLDEDADLFFHVPGVVQFPETQYVDGFSAAGKRGEVEVNRSTGAIQFSLADVTVYGAQTVEYIIPDLAIEKGMSIRLFRSPVDLGATDPTVKDVAAFYAATEATLADPLIGAPFSTLPAVPVDTQPLVVRIIQGTGSLTVDPLPDLDVPSPPAGFGYILDYDQERISIARRRENVVVAGVAQTPYSSVQLPDPGIFSAGLVLELEDTPGSGTFTPLVLDQDVLINRDAGLVTLTDTSGTQVTTGSAGSSVGTTVLTDTSQDFVAAGVVIGDYLVIPAGASTGVYTITAVGTVTLDTDAIIPAGTNIPYEVRRDKEVLADRFFREVLALDPDTRVERLNNLGTTTNAPRLSIPLTFADPTILRFRFGTTTFSTSTVTVVNDGAFTAPASLAQGTVEVSLDTGNLNFSDADVLAGQDVYWSRALTFGIDFQVNAVLGFIEFTDRMLENEEVFLRYARIGANDTKEVIEERGTFIVRKELTADHPIPTSTLFFNPLGREFAQIPAPQAFRGGRPQITGEQVAFDFVASSVTFQSAQQATDALPFGSTVNPEENVYIDYFVYGAIGGEKTLTVIQPPFLPIIIQIEAGEPDFTMAGDRTADFEANHLLQIDSEEIYLIGGSSYDVATDRTTVTLAGTQTFRSAFRDPLLAVTSGQTRITATFPFFASYFVTEIATFTTVARGQPRFIILGDVSRTYQSGTVILWEVGVFQDFNLVEGSVYDAATNQTTITMSSNGARQYNAGVATLKRSVRPVLPSPIAAVTTQRDPDLSLPHTVWRRVEGQAGIVLSQPEDYTINDAGVVTFVEPLQEDEELSIFYTGLQVIDDGRDIRASYSHLVIPTTTNGLANQVLQMDYTTYAPDSFYWRVETMTNYRAELSDQFSANAQASIPSGGPRLENAGQPRLFEQGRESLFFQERRLDNEDIVAVSTLKWYNDGINLLEDALQSMDGRIVGDHDGRFLFDGLKTNPPRTTFGDVTNQIDDLLQISVTPVITFPPLGTTFEPVYESVYKASSFSRFFPTKRTLFSVMAPPTGLVTGDVIGAFEFGSIAKVNQLHRRQPWAVVTEAAPAGSTVFEVDTTEEEEDLIRPEWDTAAYTHRVGILAQDGTVLVDGSIAPAQVASTTTTSITMTAPVAAAVPVGATIYQIVTEATPPAQPVVPPLHPKFYRPNFDVGINRDEGEATHVEPYPPYDGTFFTSPPESELNIANPSGGESLDAVSDITNRLVEPDRFPALDGDTKDDDRNRQFPILNPSSTSETGGAVGYIQQELALIETGGRIRSTTTAPFVGTGSLSLAETRITLDAGTFPAPIPKVNDIVRITSGANAGLSYRRVSATDGSTYVEVTGGDSWPTPDTAFAFTVAVSASLETGAASGTISGLTTFTDPGATFQTNGVQPGHTLVVTNGANLGLRRQVVSVTSETVLVTEAWPANQAAVSYTVDDSLSTYGGTALSLIDAELVPALAGELGVLITNVPPANVYNQQDALEMFLDNFFTDIGTSTAGQTTAAGTTLTDTTIDFVALGVDASHYIFVRSGDNAGAYRVDTVTDSDNLEVLGGNPFPDTSVITDYRIVDSGGLILQTLQDVQAVLEDVEAAAADTTAFQTLIAGTVSVLNDAGAHANDWALTDLNLREAEVNARILQVDDPSTGSTATLGSVMSSGDRLYDRRFVWIDARINQETGILPKQERAVTNRQKSEADILKQLTKLLTT